CDGDLVALLIAADDQLLALLHRRDVAGGEEQRRDEQDGPRGRRTTERTAHGFTLFGSSQDLVDGPGWCAGSARSTPAARTDQHAMSRPRSREGPGRPAVRSIAAEVPK